jgi:AraC-like DNA-binding protein
MNTIMKASALQIYIPQKPLSDAVAMMWQYIGYQPPHPKERILPLGCMELTIDLTEAPFVLEGTSTGVEPSPVYGPMLTGPRSQAFVIQTAKAASLVSVLFKPGGARRFFGVSAEELHNLHMPLACVWGAEAAWLSERVLEAKTTQARFYALQQALLRRLSIFPPRHRAVEAALHILQQGPHRIGPLMEKIALGQTQFIRLFREEVGMPPKRFARVQRFQRAARMIAQGEEGSWADVALACGYYDQAHLINDFQALAGISPSQYKPQDPAHYGNLPVFEM